jgi:DNA-binding CsgD family transcriptional regulator
MDLQRLVELNREGKTDAEIASILNVSRQLVQVKRKGLGLKSPFKYSSFRKMDYEEVEKLVRENRTDKEIAELYNVKPISVYFFRKRNNIERENLLLNKAVEPTNRQLSIIVGSLLGDASLRKTNINPIFKCEHGIRQAGYCKWKAEELKSLGSKFTTSKRKTIDPRTGICYESATCRLPANPVFLKLYNSLYVDGRKTITREYLQYFDELSLAVMFMDDGYKLGKTVGIATNCFTTQELTDFNDFISEKFGLAFNITKSNTLYLPSLQYPAFEELVLPYMHKDLMYKLNVS